MLVKKKKEKAVVTDGIEGNSCLFLFLFDTLRVIRLAVLEVLGKAELYSCSSKINNIKMPYQRISVEIDIQAAS